MKTQLRLFLPVFAAAVLLTSCSSDDDAVDTQKPTMTIVEPHDEEGIAPGGEIHFEALFADNVELASYKIEIHEDFDGHTHSLSKSSHQDNPWVWSQVFEIPESQTSFQAEQHIDVPTEVNGEPISEGAYHFGVFLTDTAGNEQQSFLEIHIESGDDDHDH